jgi:hypothetical protein
MALGRKDAKAPKGKLGSSRKGGKTAEVFDATPEEDGIDISHDGKSAGKPHDIRETKAWQKGQKGVQKLWQNYLDFLGGYFRTMDRDEQVSTIEKFCVTLTVGISMVVLACFYSMLLQPVRVIALPLVLGGAWWFGSKVITPVMVTRLNRYIKPE